MNSKTSKAYIELLRPLNIGIVFLTIAAAALIAGARTADGLVVVLAALAGALIAGGGYALNDYFDLEIDRINRPSRPLPRGVVSKEGALWAWGLTSAAGVLASAYLGSYTFAIALFWTVSLYFYNRTYKRTIFAGNVLVGVITGLAFVYGAVAVGNVERSWFPALFALLINVARELIKDVEDLEGDAKENAQTLPVKYGIKPALMLASLTIVLLVTATVLPYSSGIYTIEYLIIVGLVNVALLYVVISMWMDRSPSNLSKLSLILKLNMILGLIAIFVGS